MTQIALGFAGGVVAQAPKAAGALTPPVYVVHISVDGLRPEYLQQLLTAGQAPNFARLKAEGAWTFNARTDYDITVTLPNHVSMLTGRPINNKYGITNSGHRWTLNSTPPPGATLHTNAGYYVASAFDVAHDNGYSTALYASKDKFVLFRDSYNATNGALDVTGANNGRQKIDVYVNNDQNSTAMFSTFLTNMTASPTNYTFLHFTDPDTAGHAGGWGSAAYMATLTNIDAKLGQLFGLIAGSSLLAGNTTIILGADHGGVGTDHSNATLWENYVIEMMLWGPSMSRQIRISTRSMEH
ncbi:MAG: alkaline phosphatase family protein [Anaerolineae bacterium]|nr:alkaline phosphatase family protein [Anaerolineae bacterium]